MNNWQKYEDFKRNDAQILAAKASKEKGTPFHQELEEILKKWLEKHGM